MGSPPGAAPPARPATLTPAIIILGADALLAARPALPGQLANACYAAGYSAVIPASWGDELVAAGCLREIAARGQGSVVLCACPRVAERMRRVESLLPHLLPLAAPPVAAARYLRARAGRHGVHITYVGDCPAGADSSIDRHATPGALLRSLAKRGIDPTAQPTEVEERLLRDARRFYSLPGGAPAPNWLYVEKRGYTLIEPTARDFLAEVAFRVSKRERRVVDLSPRLGCSCSGAVVGQPWTQARDTVAALEPPRAVHEVLDHDVAVDLAAPLEPWTGSATSGEATVPIALETLAAMYDPDTKASTIRTLPPPPIPRRPRTSAGSTVEPTTLVRPGAASAETTGETPAADVGAREDAPALIPAGAGAGEAPAPDREPQLPRELHADMPDIWPGPEPRLSGESRRSPGAQGPDGEWAAWEARPGRLRRWAVILACLMLAVAATAAVGMLLLGRGPFASSHPAARAPSGSTPSRTSPSVPDTSAPAPTTTPADSTSARSSDSASADTSASVVPPAPDLPRLPIRPTAIAGPAHGANAPIVPPDATLHPPRANRLNPAPVYTPGAAPIPRRATPGSRGQRDGTGPLPPAGADSGGAEASPSPSSHTPAELAAIRDEIARRRRRVDSLRHVIDSLSKKTAPDTSSK